MALILSACSFSAFSPFSSPSLSPGTPETSAEPDSVTVVNSSFTTVSGNTAQLVPLATEGKFFYCVSEEKTGESIPEEAVKAAKKKKKEVVNDGRYDTFSVSLYKLRPNGSLYRLPDYVGILPEENTDGWSDFSSVVSIDALHVNEDGTFTVLEHTATSGNSMPKDRTKYQAGKDYLEYVLRYYLRTLSRSGSETACVEISQEEAENLLKTKFNVNPLTAVGNDVLDSSGNILFSFSDAGISADDLCSEVTECTAIDTGSGSTVNTGTEREFFCLCETYDTKTGQFTYEIARTALREVPSENHTFLRLGYDDVFPCSRLLETIASFNRNHDAITIKLVPLPDDNSGAAFSSLEGTDSIDLLYIDNQTCTDLAASGLLADLYPYLDADRNLKRENYLPNILTASERNGRLCSTCSGFTVSTVIGESDIVGDRCSWTYDDLREAWGTLGIGTDAFHVYTDREDVFRSCLKMDLSTIVSYDSTAGVYHVDSDKLTQLQWFCGNFPLSFDYSGRTLNAADASDLRIRNGKQLLLPVHLSSFEDLKICGYAFNGEIAFVGYPTLSGCGSTLTITTLDPGMNFSMMASCNDPQAAWEFLRTFFTASWQTEQTNANACFPSLIRCFERGLKSAMSGEYAVDKDGALVYDKDNKLIHVSLGSLYLSDYTEVRYYPVSTQRAAAFRNLVDSLTKTETMLPDSEAIIDELCRQYLAS